jgi:uncharacterized protein (TIGR02265 family)
MGVRLGRVNDAAGHEAWPIGSEEEFRHRLSLVTPGDTTRGLFLNGVLQAVRQLGGEAAVQHCLAESGEKRFLDLFNYPVDTMLRMSYAGARRLSDETRTFDEVMRQMGYVSARSFATSTMGAIMLRLVISDSRRLLDAMPSAHRMNTSAGGCKVHWTGFHSAVLRITRDYLPHSYTEGALQGAFEAARVRGLTVRCRPTPSLDNDYELSWD